MWLKRLNIYFDKTTSVFMLLACFISWRHFWRTNVILIVVLFMSSCSKYFHQILIQEMRWLRFAEHGDFELLNKHIEIAELILGGQIVSYSVNKSTLHPTLKPGKVYMKSLTDLVVGFMIRSDLKIKNKNPKNTKQFFF